MTFYQAMQLNPANSKKLIRDTEDKKLKKIYTIAFIVKNILCIAFCIAFVTMYAKIFGDENSITGVVVLIALLTYRISNIDVKVGQASIILVGIFLILAIGPHMANLTNPFIALLINFASIMLILILSCHNTILSNHSIFVLGYLLLYGYDVSGVPYVNRVVGLIIGGIVVAIIFYIKNRKIDFKTSFTDLFKEFDLRSERGSWQLKLAIAISTVVMIGELIHLPRVMWVGFACMSIINPNPDAYKIRLKKRAPFMVVGCLVFFVTYNLLPSEYVAFIGIIGGLMVGFSGTYEWQTVFNCFGALVSAIGVFGLVNAIILRILNNVIGTVYSFLFVKIYDKVFDMYKDSDNCGEVADDTAC